MPEGCTVAMSADATFRRGVSCSQKTQAAVTTNAIGIQCTLTFLINTSSQTEVEFPVRDLDNTQDGASQKFPASGDGADMAPGAGPCIYFCSQYSDNTGNVSTDSKNIQFGGELYSCLRSQQRNYHATHGKVCASKMPYIGASCKQVFHKNFSLDRHTRLHTGKGPLVCSTCNESFARRFDLARHKRLHFDERPYVCKICQKSFTRRSNLARHERLHSDESPYVCSICQKSFTRKDLLVIHARYHSGERPYVCGICNKGFTTRCTLVAHEKLHSGERPYACSICQKCFAQKSNLVQHARLHSGERP